MYVEVCNIMAFNLYVPDPSKQEQPPDVVRERPWHLFLSRYCRLKRKDAHTHTHAHALAHTRIRACTQTHDI